MRLSILIMLLSLIALMNVMAQPPDVLWVYSRSADGNCWSAVATHDGGNVIVGSNDSNWLVLRVDSTGTEVWSRVINFSSSELDRALDIVQGINGDIYVCGDTYASIARLVRFNYSTGDTVWSRTYRNQMARGMIQTADGGFALAGVASGNGDDFLVIRTDSNGVQIWAETYGAGLAQDAYAIAETSDGGFAVFGLNQVAVNDVDYCLLRLSSSGDSLWSRT